MNIIKQLIAHGETCASIAAALMVSTRTVHGWSQGRKMAMHRRARLEAMLDMRKFPAPSS